VFARVLTANRSEIACRVAKSVQAAGGQAVAVYNDADEGAPHVALCDVTVPLGGSTAAVPYLDVDKVTLGGAEMHATISQAGECHRSGRYAQRSGVLLADRPGNAAPWHRAK
jgi:acetyl-CoA/propionyl-CoA carboxylase biotin carboxyl carrier protein